MGANRGRGGGGTHGIIPPTFGGWGTQYQVSPPHVFDQLNYALCPAMGTNPGGKRMTTFLKDGEHLIPPQNRPNIAPQSI